MWFFMPEQSTSRRAKSVAGNARSAPAMRPLCALRIRTRYATVSNECSTTRPLSRSWLVGAAHVLGAPGLSRIQAVAAEVGASVGRAAARGRSVRSTAVVTRQPFIAVSTSHRRPKNAVSRFESHAAPLVGVGVGPLNSGAASRID